ncbi:MAG: recombination regulator RecX [Gammaproteobacteria bacterium]|nr:recombination regulator RecX [Gammaproteobacteria bacterium]
MRTTPEEPRPKDSVAGGDSGERPLYTRALARLARRDHARGELAAWLRRHGGDEDTLNAVLDRLAAEGYLDDERYARERLRVLLRRGKGLLLIRAELTAVGLARELVDRCLAETRGAALASAAELCHRRLGSGWERDPGRVARARQLLARRGYEAATLRALLRGEDHELDEDPPREEP